MKTYLINRSDFLNNADSFPEDCVLYFGIRWVMVALMQEEKNKLPVIALPA
jgi:hypothetical protein